MIIGLCGYARSGKDELARVLISEWGFVRYAFADVLKEAALKADPWITTGRGWVRLSALVDSIGWEGAKTFPEGREFLQRMGVGMRRTLGEDVWLDEVVDRIYTDKRAKVAEHFVITDVRFPNEAKWVKDVGYLVRVTRPGVGPANGHESETAIDDVDAYEFANTGGLSDLATYGSRLPQLLRGVR